MQSVDSVIVIKELFESAVVDKELEIANISEVDKKLFKSLLNSIELTKKSQNDVNN